MASGENEFDTPLLGSDGAYAPSSRVIYTMV